jgi:AcrR family transcriptional regulator
LESGQQEADPRVTDISARAGVAHGTFYRYFLDRPSAVEALMAGFIGFLHDSLMSARDVSAGPPTRIRAATLNYVRLFRANTGLMRRLMSLEATDTPARERFHALNRDWNTRVAAAIARHRARSSVSPPEAPERLLPTAYALGGMIEEFLAQLYLRQDPALRSFAESEEAVADLLSSIWYRGTYGDLAVAS